MRLAIAIALVAACSSEPSLDDLVQQSDAIATFHEQILNTFVIRVSWLKTHMGHNQPGWERSVRVAEMANDLLGLSPFAQTVPTKPGRVIPPASLLGMGPYVHDESRKRAQQGDRHGLEFLVQDEERRYCEGEPKVTALLDDVEGWVAAQSASRP
jgi:hypothetical protein